MRTKAAAISVCSFAEAAIQSPYPSKTDAIAALRETLEQQEERRVTDYTSTFTSSPSIFTGYTSTFAEGFFTHSPVATLNCQPCQGQVTTFPSTSPSPKG